MGTRHLPPRRDYPDTPPWAHNFDNVRVRTVNAAWNVLLTRDLSEVSHGDLAREVGVTPAALYHHFPTPADLAAELAVASMAAIRQEMNAAAEKHGEPREAFRAFFEFARRRPRHFVLLAAPRFNGAPGVAAGRKKLGLALDVVLQDCLRRRPNDLQRRTLRVLLHGAGAMIAAGSLKVGEAMTILGESLTAWRRG